MEGDDNAEVDNAAAAADGRGQSGTPHGVGGLDRPNSGRMGSIQSSTTESWISFRRRRPL